MEYLTSYVAKHSLDKYFHYSCEVLKLKKVEDDYEIKYKENDEIKRKRFSRVIVATGVYSKPHFSIENSGIYQGVFLHSGYYRDSAIFTNKKVVCIGQYASGNDIAYEASLVASKVTQIIRKPTIVAPKYVNGLPAEFYKQYKKILNSQNLFPSDEFLKEKYKNALEFFGNPVKYHPKFEADEQDVNINFRITDDVYLEAVSAGKIEIVDDVIKELYESGIVLGDGTRIEADVLVFGTGFAVNYDFLSKELRRILKYEENCLGLSMSLYRSILHPELPRLCFVGNIKGGIPCRFELGAIVAVKHFTGTLDVSDEELWEGVRAEDRVRAAIPPKKIPYDPFSYLFDFLRIAKIEINTELIDNELGFKNGFFLPQFLALNNSEVLDACKRVIAEIKAKYPQMEFS